MNKKQAFAYFGIKQKNQTWSWSGINDDHSLVAMTIWTDQYIEIKKDKVFFWSTFNQNNDIWKDSLGNLERIKLIKICLERLNGMFRPIFVEPKNPNINNETRKIAKTHKPDDKCWFKIVQFNENTGECSAVGYRE